MTPAATRPSPAPILIAAAWMTGTLACFCAMALAVRAMTPKLSTFDVMAVRGAFNLLVLGSIALLSTRHRAQLRTQRLGFHVSRNVLHYAAQYIWAWGVAVAPLAIVFSMEFSGPVWVTALASVFLGERLTLSRLACVALGFIGVLVIVDPSGATFETRYLLLVLIGLGFALVSIMTKSLTRTETSFTIMFYLAAAQLPLSLVGINPAAFATLDTREIIAALVFGIASLGVQWCITSAYRAADVVVVMPMDFLRVPFIAVVAWLLYAEPVQANVLIGAVIMLVGIVWNLHAETRRPAPARP